MCNLRSLPAQLREFRVRLLVVELVRHSDEVRLAWPQPPDDAEALRAIAGPELRQQGSAALSYQSLADLLCNRDRQAKARLTCSSDRRREIFGGKQLKRNSLLRCLAESSRYHDKPTGVISPKILSCAGGSDPGKACSQTSAS